jgi:2'-hydroxyisoflavone reductase
MRALVLGGTQFLGRHIVAALLARGDDVTIVHRGEHGAELFPNVTRVIGDRARDLDRLPKQDWDAVIDTCGYVPSIVTASARALRDRAARYVFVSSVSVYDIDASHIDESSPTLTLPEGASPDVYAAEHYGPLKALCERAAADGFGAQRTFVMRPGLIVGPYDPTDRFTAWPLRFARGGRVAVPEDPAAHAQWIDARDLADFTLHAIDAGHHGIVNTVGPAAPTTFAALMDACMMHAPAGTSLVPFTAAKLSAAGVGAWMDMPCWVPSDGDARGIVGVDPTLGTRLGLQRRPLAVTIADTLVWAQRERCDAQLKAGLGPERERALLDAHH